jgi:ribosomal subunit interface protein
MFAVLERAPSVGARSKESISMQTATTFRDMPSSPALQAAALRWTARLEHVSDRIVACHVSIEKPHRHHLHGSEFQVNVTLTVPGGQIVANHSSPEAYVALANAFRAVRRQLVQHVDGQRHFVKGPAGGHYDGFVASKP